MGRAPRARVRVAGASRAAGVQPAARVPARAAADRGGAVIVPPAGTCVRPTDTARLQISRAYKHRTRINTARVQIPRAYRYRARINTARV